MDTGRMAMCLPYPYWILDTPLAHFIGLYTNVPEGGWMDEGQEAWLAAQLKAAPDNKASFMTGEYVCVDGGYMALGAWAGGAGADH